MESIGAKIMGILDGFCLKLSEAISSVYGWVVAAILFVVNYCVGFETILGGVAFCVLCDAVWGIAVSVKLGRFTVSELARNSFFKLAVYCNVLAVFIVVDRISGADNPLTTAVIGAAICLVELWSITGNASIIRPNFPPLRLLRHALKGEISRKLGVAEEEVDEILK
ncbi:MAG: phage holin family protein [Alistipes sp.]